MDYFFQCYDRARTRLSFSITGSSTSPAPVISVEPARLAPGKPGQRVLIPHQRMQAYDFLVDTGAAKSFMPLSELKWFYEPEALVPVQLPERERPYLLPADLGLRAGPTGFVHPDNKPITAIAVPMSLVFKDGHEQEYTVDETIYFSPTIKHPLLGRLSFFQQLGLIYINAPHERWFGLFDLP